MRAEHGGGLTWLSTTADVFGAKLFACVLVAGRAKAGTQFAALTQLADNVIRDGDLTRRAAEGQAAAGLRGEGYQ